MKKELGFAKDSEVNKIGRGKVRRASPRATIRADAKMSGLA